MIEAMLTTHTVHAHILTQGGRPVPGGGQRVTKPQHSSFSIKASGPPWLFGEITREKAEELLIPYAPTYVYIHALVVIFDATV